MQKWEQPENWSTFIVYRHFHVHYAETVDSSLTKRQVIYKQQYGIQFASTPMQYSLEHYNN